MYEEVRNASVPRQSPRPWLLELRIVMTKSKRLELEDAKKHLNKPVVKVTLKRDTSAKQVSLPYTVGFWMFLVPVASAIPKRN